MAIERTLGFSFTVFRKKFRSGMTARSSETTRSFFRKGTKPMLCSTSRAAR